MFQIIYTTSGTIVSQHASLQDAILNMELVDSIPSKHEIVEVADIEESTENNQGE
jgi:hypothetical protein